MSGDLTTIEDALRRAYADVLEAVRRDDTSPEYLHSFEPRRSARGPGRPVRGRRRWLVPAAVGAAVATIALVAGLIVPSALQQQSPGREGMAYLSTQLRLQPGQVYAQLGAVIPINLATGRALPPIRLHAWAGSTAAITPDGRILYVLSYRGNLTPVDLVTRRAGKPVFVGNDPQQMLISPDGRIGYVIEADQVELFDIALNKPAGRIGIPAGAFRGVLTPDGSTLYVINGDGSAVTPVDTTTDRALRPIRTPANSSDLYVYSYGRAPTITMAPDGKTVYTLGNVEHGGNFLADTGVLTPISTATNTALASIPLGTGRYSGQLMFSPDGRTAYISAGVGAADRVTAVSLTTDRVSWTRKLPRSWIARYITWVSSDGRTVYALGDGHDSGPAALYRLSAATGAVEGAPIQVEPRGWLINGADLSPDGKTVYLQAYGVHYFLIPVDAATGKASRPIPIPNPGDLVFSR